MMTDDLVSSLFSHQIKKEGGMGGDCIAVISSPGLLGKDAFIMQSKIVFYATNQENMHTCKTSEEFLCKFLYKYMKYSNKAKQGNSITGLPIQQLCQG